MGETPEEIWKEYPRCSHYEVSNLGRVRSKGRLVNPKRGGVVLSEGGREWCVLVSHMVAETFYRPLTSWRDVVCRLNFDLSDNRRDNLYIGTRIEPPVATVLDGTTITETYFKERQKENN